MSFLKKFKHDKGFRNKIILLFIATVLIIGSSGKKESTTLTNEVCAAAAGSYPYDGDDFKACIDRGCVPVTATQLMEGVKPALISCSVDLIEYLGIGHDLTAYMMGCNAVVPVGAGFFSETDRTTTVCEDKIGYKVGHLLCVGDYYKCTANPNAPDNPGPTDPVQYCSGGQQPFADLMNSMWPDNPWKDNCKAEFYVVAFGGGFIVLMLLLAVI